MNLEATIDTIEALPWLNQTSLSVQHAVKDLLKSTGDIGKRAEKILSGKWLGHPLHPMMTDMTIGAYSIAWILDIIAEITDSDRYRRGADDAMLIGLLSSIATLLTGLTDWTYATGRSRKTGFVHAITNIAGSSICLASYLSRKSNRPRRFWLSMMGATVLTVGGYLGGRLVFNNAMGVEVPQKTSMSKTLQPTS